MTTNDNRQVAIECIETAMEHMASPSGDSRDRAKVWALLGIASAVLGLPQPCHGESCDQCTAEAL